MCPPIIAAVGAAASSAGTAIAGLSTAAKVSLLLGGAQAGMSIHGQRQQAKTQEKMQKNASLAERQRYLQEMTAMRARERQEGIASAQQRQEITKRAREARATGRVSAGEAGVAGLSVDALMNSFTQNEANSLFAITQQEKFNNQNRALGIQDSQMRSSSNLLRINKPIAQPDYLGAALSGAQTGMSTYSFGEDSGMNDYLNKKFS